MCIRDRIDIPVQKVWVDNNNKLGYRPDAIIVELYANGQPTGQILELKSGPIQNFWNFLTGSDTCLLYTSRCV